MSAPLTEKLRLITIESDLLIQVYCIILSAAKQTYVLFVFCIVYCILSPLFPNFFRETNDGLPASSDHG